MSQNMISKLTTLTIRNVRSTSRASFSSHLAPVHCPHGLQGHAFCFIWGAAQLQMCRCNPGCGTGFGTRLWEPSSAWMHEAVIVYRAPDITSELASILGHAGMLFGSNRTTTSIRWLSCHPRTLGQVQRRIWAVSTLSDGWRCRLARSSSCWLLLGSLSGMTLTWVSVFGPYLGRTQQRKPFLQLQAAVGVLLELSTDSASHFALHKETLANEDLLYDHNLTRASAERTSNQAEAINWLSKG